MSLYTNRSFKYGDGIFETIRWVDGKIAFCLFHFERILQGFKTLNFEAPPNFSQEWLKLEIKNHIINHYNEDNSNRRVRITFWRDGNGLYSPDSNSVNWFIESSVLSEPNFKLNTQGLDIGIHPNLKLHADILSPLKSCSALVYVMASDYKNRIGWNDCILLNTFDRITESSSSNIFVIKNGKIYTPALNEGPIMGIVRRAILDIAAQHKISVFETQLNIDFLMAADEIWLTNAISGIRWVAKLQGATKNFGSELANTFVQLLNQCAFKI